MIKKVFFAALLLCLLSTLSVATTCDSLCTYSEANALWTCTGNLACDTLDNNNASILIENATFSRAGANGAGCGSAGVEALGRFNTTYGNLTANNVTLTFNGGNGNTGACNSAGAGASGSLELRGVNTIISKVTANSYGGNGGSGTGPCGNSGREAGSGTLIIHANQTLTFNGTKSTFDNHGGSGGSASGCSPCSSGGSAGTAGSSTGTIQAQHTEYTTTPDIYNQGGNAGGGRGNRAGGSSSTTINSSTQSIASGNFLWRFYSGQAQGDCGSAMDGTDSIANIYADIFKIAQNTTESTINISGGLPSSTGTQGNSLFYLQVTTEATFNENVTIDTKSGNTSKPKINITSTSLVNRFALFNTLVPFNLSVFCGKTGLNYGTSGIRTRNISFDSSCETLINQTSDEYNTVVTYQDINLTSLKNGIANFTAYYTFTGASISNCTIVTPTENFTVTNSSQTCNFTNVNTTQSNTLTITPRVNTVSGGYASGNTTNAVRVLLNQYFWNNTVLSTLTSQNFLREWNITNAIARLFSNIEFSEDTSHDVRTVNVAASATTPVNNTHAQNLFNQSNWTINTTTIIINSTYSLNQTLTYNNTLTYPLPELNITQNRTACEGTPSFKTTAGADVNFTYNTTHITTPFTSVGAAQTVNRSFGCVEQPITIVQRSAATNVDLGSTLNYTFNETYQSKFNLSNEAQTTFSTTAYLPEWDERLSFNSTLNDSNGNNKTHTLTYDSLNKLLTLNFTNPTTTNYTFRLAYEVPDTGGDGGGGDVGAGGGGASETTTTTTINILLNETFTVKPRTVRRFVPWFPDLDASKRVTTVLVANQQLKSCTQSDPISTCQINQTDATLTTLLDDSTNWVTTYQDLVRVTSIQDETITVDYRIDLIALTWPRLLILLAAGLILWRGLKWLFQNP